MKGKRKKKAVNEQQDWSLNLNVVHANAAGIDIGNEWHYVAVPPDRDAAPVRQFACFTEALQGMAAWLKSCGIETVAMQSTGVYWLRASREEIARSLEGNWRKELLFILQQELNLYQIYQQQIAECDTALAAHLRTLDNKVEPGSQPPAAKAGKKAGTNAPTSFDLRGELYRISGADLTQIDGINIMNAQTIIAEVGVDMSRFPSEAHFASFLGLCPDNQITGGKVFRRGTRHVDNRAATALRMAATSLWRSKTYLGAKFRRLRARLGAPKAITAMAHMLARLVYRMLRYGEQYVDKGMNYYEEKYREHEIRSI
jgi:hypothetical protein